ncbi:oligopeptide transport ATP-binding protein OppD [Thermacetogenium phaeum DSM 12270]|uniref:Nickel import system ATP-binding protein NikD n=1 Tax=Thermacetogenium phaeum (strain ATCC BAA-254 / DSM 26808 / PB) TaxID=1089553 RepID=K4LXI3_THEPS|nr:oligopeptide transport ATP-binding protein OppD [Thermacetogenium phaeum DSM 12270]
MIVDSNLLLIRNLSVEFPGPGGSIRAVDKVDLEIEKGERVALVGETGSGKSVLLLSLLRLLPAGARISGEVWYEGRNLLRLSEDELCRIRGRELAYIPQGTGNALNPVLTVGIQVAEPLIVHLGFKKRPALAKAVSLLGQLGIPEAQKRAFEYPHQYSGGMKQRALVAMGVVAEPEVLLADEPTKGVDWERREEILNLFQSLTGKTILTVTHDLCFAEKFAEKVAVMYAAQIVEVAPRAEFFRQPLHPYAQALLAALPPRGLRPLAGYAPEHASYGEPGCRFRMRCPRAFRRCQEEPPLLEENGRRVRCWLYVS